MPHNITTVEIIGYESLYQDALVFWIITVTIQVAGVSFPMHPNDFNVKLI